LIVGWIPGWPGSSALPIPNTASTQQDMFILSGCNAVIISASNQDSVKISVPFLSPQEYLDYVDLSPPTTDGRIATLFVREMNTLTSTQANQTASLPINVWAGFDSLEVTGFTSESDKHNKEASKKASQGLDTKGIVSTASKMLRKAPIIGEGYGIVADLFNSFAGDLSKPTYNTSQTPVMPVYQKEAALCHANTYAEQVSMYPNAYLSQEPTIGGMETSHLTVSKLAQKPMLVSVVACPGNTSFTMDATPLACGATNVSGTAPTNTLIGDWLANVALPFQYWRGSIKYALHFCVPSFYSFRARVSLNRQSSLPVIDIGDLESTVIDVKGDTWFEFQVPYLYSTLWRTPLTDFSGSDAAPTIKVEIITPIVGSAAPATPIVFVNVFRSGGEDTQFSRLRGVRPNTQNFTSECSLDTVFKSPFKGIISGTTQALEQGWVQPESAHTVSDCIKRRSNHIFNTFPRTSPWSFPPGASNINYATLGGEPFNYFSAMFRFWRGGRIITHNQPVNLISLQNDATATTWGDGAVPFFTSATNQLYNNEAMHIPWYSMTPFYPTLGPGQAYDSGYTGDSFVSYFPTDQFGLTSSTTQVSIQAADDFMLIYPVPFFPCYFSPINFAPGALVPLKAKRRLQKPGSHQSRPHS